MRENRLTQCLTESLNGKAITILIAAISPAAINYGDTISTLRFADNAKRLKVKPQKKLDPTAQMIADLKEENERLRQVRRQMSPCLALPGPKLALLGPAWPCLALPASGRALKRCA